MKFKGQIIRQIAAWLNTVINHIQMKENKYITLLQNCTVEI